MIANPYSSIDPIRTITLHEDDSLDDVFEYIGSRDYLTQLRVWGPGEMTSISAGVTYQPAANHPIVISEEHKDSLIAMIRKTYTFGDVVEPQYHILGTTTPPFPKGYKVMVDVKNRFLPGDIVYNKSYTGPLKVTSVRPNMFVSSKRVLYVTDHKGNEGTVAEDDCSHYDEPARPLYVHDLLPKDIKDIDYVIHRNAEYYDMFWFVDRVTKDELILRHPFNEHKMKTVSLYTIAQQADLEIVLRLDNRNRTDLFIKKRLEGVAGNPPLPLYHVGDVCWVYDEPRRPLWYRLATLGITGPESGYEIVLNKNGLTGVYKIERIDLTGLFSMSAKIQSASGSPSALPSSRRANFSPTRELGVMRGFNLEKAYPQIAFRQIRNTINADFSEPSRRTGETPEPPSKEACAEKSDSPLFYAPWDVYQTEPKGIPAEESLPSDFYGATASLLFQTPIEEVTEDMRKAAKRRLFGALYGGFGGLPCCKRDLDMDGNCDVHPSKVVTGRYSSPKSSIDSPTTELITSWCRGPVPHSGVFMVKPSTPGMKPYWSSMSEGYDPGTPWISLVTLYNLREESQP